jgi:deoxyribonuclease V
MRHLHDWNLSYEQARQIQLRLAGKVKIAHLKRAPRLVAGLDCAFSADGKRIVAAVVVLKIFNSPSPKPPTVPTKACIGNLNSVMLPSELPILNSEFTIPNSRFQIIETTHAVNEVSFPYIPGLLSFREAPACIAAVEKLHTKPDVFLIDGQGLAHPRRLGIACHLGLWFDKPTVGCAKSRLIGVFNEPGSQTGAYSLLKDAKYSGRQITSNEPRLSRASPRESTSNEAIGAVVRTRAYVKPMFVSVGHKCTLEDAVNLVLAWTSRYRLPEPVRLAHQLVTRLKSRI